MQVLTSIYQISQRSRTQASRDHPEWLSFLVFNCSGGTVQQDSGAWDFCCGIWIGECRRKHWNRLLCRCCISSQSSSGTQNLGVNKVLQGDPIHFRSRLGMQRRGYYHRIIWGGGGLKTSPDRPAAESEVNTQLEAGCWGLCLVGSWKLARTEISVAPGKLFPMFDSPHHEIFSSYQIGTVLWVISKNKSPWVLICGTATPSVILQHAGSDLLCICTKLEL